MKLTSAQLSALPEEPSYTTRLISEDEAKAMGGKRGDTIRERVPIKLCAYKMEPDDVILFHDEQGSWMVVYHLEGGPYKRRFSL